MKKLLLFTLLIFLIPSYQWAVRDIGYRNLMTVYDYPKMSLEQKYLVKLSRDYQLVLWILQNVPEDKTVIIPREVWEKTKWAKRRVWLTYFLYPREFVYEQ